MVFRQTNCNEQLFADLHFVFWHSRCPWWQRRLEGDCKMMILCSRSSLWCSAFYFLSSFYDFHESSWRCKMHCWQFYPWGPWFSDILESDLTAQPIFAFAVVLCSCKCHARSHLLHPWVYEIELWLKILLLSKEVKNIWCRLVPKVCSIFWTTNHKISGPLLPGQH